MKINNELTEIGIKNCTYYYYDNIISINPNETEGGGGDGGGRSKRLPWYILLYNFLVTQRRLFLKFMWDSYSEIVFPKFGLLFGVPALFHDQLLLLFFSYVFCWKNEDILDNISSISVQKA